MAYKLVVLALTLSLLAIAVARPDPEAARLLKRVIEIQDEEGALFNILFRLVSPASMAGIRSFSE